MGAEKEKEQEREKRPVRCYSDFADKVRAIADFRDINMEDVLEKYAGTVIDRQYRKVVEEMHAAITVGGEG